MSYHVYTTGWSKIHGVPWFDQNTRVQCDIEVDEDSSKQFLLSIREWDKVTGKITETEFDWRIYADLTPGEDGFLSRPLTGEAFWIQANAGWQPVNQRILDEVYRCCTSF